MSALLLTETADYETGGSWGPASNGWPNIKGVVAYDMYAFANCVATIPYGSYVLMARRGQYGDEVSILKIHADYIDTLKDDFKKCGSPAASTSLDLRAKYGKKNSWGNSEQVPILFAIETLNLGKL